MSYQHFITYINEDLLKYAFNRDMIICFWCRDNGIKHISVDVLKLIIMFSVPTNTKQSETKSMAINKPWNRTLPWRQQMGGRRSFYQAAIRQTLRAVLCLMDSPQIMYYNQDVQYPNIEMRYNKEYLMNPLIISRNELEKCLIEGSMNSVRISFKLRITDWMETMLYDKWIRFLQHRASLFGILRKQAIKNYDISFLITHQHLLHEFNKTELIEVILEFILIIQEQVASLRLFVCGRSTLIARSWARQFITS